MIWGWRIFSGGGRIGYGWRREGGEEIVRGDLCRFCLCRGEDGSGWEMCGWGYGFYVVKEEEFVYVGEE